MAKVYGQKNNSVDITFKSNVNSDVVTVAVDGFGQPFTFFGVEQASNYVQFYFGLSDAEIAMIIFEYENQDVIAEMPRTPISETDVSFDDWFVNATLNK